MHYFNVHLLHKMRANDHRTGFSLQCFIIYKVLPKFCFWRFLSLDDACTPDRTTYAADSGSAEVVYWGGGVIALHRKGVFMKYMY